MHAFQPEMIEHYRREGYVVEPRLSDRGTLSRVDECLAELVNQALQSGDWSRVMELEPGSADGRPVPRRIYEPFAQHQVFRGLATDDRVLDRIEQLIGASIALQHSKLNMKPAKVGSVVEWHQDLTYFPHTNDDLVTTLIYLDDATVENGCLQVLPRKHGGYLNHCNPDGTFAGMITEPIRDQPVSLEAPAGSVIFMHCLTPHSSLPNRSAHRRRTLIFEYRAGDAYPITVGPTTHQKESLVVQLRGQPAPFARLGKINPFIPRFRDPVTSLYDLQERTKARTNAPSLAPSKR